MDIRVLKYFLAVAREENITRAAESLHIAQPSLSKQMMELEQELGKTLLIRGKRKVTLTEEGILLRKRAEDILSLVEKTEREISSDFTDISGEIAIGGGALDTILQAAASLHTKHPQVTFQFYSGDATDIMEQLDHGMLDFATLLPPVDITKYEYLTLPDTSIWGVLMKKDSEFASLDVIKKDDLLQMPLILHRRIGLQQTIADWAGVDLDRLHITATYNVMQGTALPFVQNNLGCLVTARNQLAPELDGSVVFRPLEPELKIRYNLVWKRKNVFSNAAQAFLEGVRNGIADFYR